MAGFVYRGASVTLPRMNAHRMVVAAAALTTLVAAMVASALAVLGGQALPAATHADLSAADTTLLISGSVSTAQDAQFRAQLPGQISAALHRTPFSLYHGQWSDAFGFTSGGLSGGAASGNTPIAEAAALDDITAHAVLVSGTWPVSLTATGGSAVVEAALPVTTASVLHLAPGDTLRMRDRVTGKPCTFKITGLFRPAALTGIASRYWHLDTIGPAGYRVLSGFVTYGPLAVPPAAFAKAIAAGAATWLAQPDTDRIQAGQATAIAASVTGLQQSLASQQILPSMQLSTALPALLTSIAEAQNVARALLAMCAIILALLAGAALLAVARLLAGQREGETAMLAARGATRGQLIRLSAAEAVPLCLVAALAGGAGGIWLARVLVPPSPASVPASTVQTAVALAAGALVIMLVPVLARLTPGAARARRGRQAAISTASRAGADLALIALAVLACWQLLHYSVVSAGTSGTFGVDPVVAAAPALALAAGTVTALRLLPIAGLGFDRLAARGRRLVTALASWQISRQPIRQAGAALLIVLAVATATLALTQRASWRQSDHDQAAFSTGADVRVLAAQPLTPAQAGALTRLPGVRHATPVADFGYALDASDVLAMNARDIPAIVRLRRDQLPGPEASVFGKLAVPPAIAAPVPGRPASIAFTVTFGPASLRLSNVSVALTVEDADNDAYQLPEVALSADGRPHLLTFPVTGQSAIYPLRITQLQLTYQMPAAKPKQNEATLSIAGLPGLSRLLASSSSPDIDNALNLPAFSGASGMSSSYAKPGQPFMTSADPLTMTFAPGYGLTSPQSFPPSQPVNGIVTLLESVKGNTIPAIATQSFIDAHNDSAGSTVSVNLGGVPAGLHIVGVVPDFPTTLPAGTLIVDLAAIQDLLVSNSADTAPTLQWLLATDHGQVPPTILETLPDGSSVLSRVAIEHQLLTDPMSAVPQQALLGVGIAALLLAATGFCVSIAASVRQRRAENALLAALGLAPRAAAAQLCLEKFMLSLPSALAGLGLGAVLAKLIVPAITLSPTGVTPVPPVLITFGWGPTLGAAALLAILPVLVAALVMVRRPDPAAALRAAEAA